MPQPTQQQGPLQSAYNTILNFLPQTSGLMKASQALGQANARSDLLAQKLKDYQDKYGPVNGQRIFDEEQAKARGGK